MESTEQLAAKARQLAKGFKESPPPSRLPIVLSVVFPGLGEFAQRRWVAGAFFLLTFLLSFLSVILVSVGQYMEYMRALTAIGKNADYAQQDFPFLALLVPLAIALLAILGSILDTWMFFQKQQRAWYEQKMERHLAGLVPVLLLAICIPLAAAGADVSPREIHRAIMENNVARLDSLLETAPAGVAGRPIKDGITPLHMAAAGDRHSLAVLLVGYGADVNATNNAGFTPLHWAARQNATNTAQRLIQLGAKVTARTPQGITPLHWAAAGNMTNMIQLLTAAHANLDATTADGFTPLDWAIQNDAEDAAILIAFEMANRQLADELARGGIAFTPARLPPPADTNSPPVPDTGDVPPPTVGMPRPEPGASLKVPIGHYQTLEFVWVEDLKIWFGRHEISNGQYRRFNARHDSLFRDTVSLNEDTQPAVYVSWEEASAYCAWLNRMFADRIPKDCEFRLPLDKEWTDVARAGDSRQYPWGNEMPPRYGNFSDITARQRFATWRGIDNYNDGFAVSCPVDRSGSNEQGIFGLAGNVWEWCDDWYDKEKKHKIRHGGSWDFDTEPALRIDHRGRDVLGARYDTLGFRVVVAPKP